MVGLGVCNGDFFQRKEETVQSGQKSERQNGQKRVVHGPDTCVGALQWCMGLTGDSKLDAGSIVVEMRPLALAATREKWKR